MVDKNKLFKRAGKFFTEDELGVILSLMSKELPKVIERLEKNKESASVSSLIDTCR